jgi:hypothetical protein
MLKNIDPLNGTFILFQLYDRGLIKSDDLLEKLGVADIQKTLAGVDDLNVSQILLQLFDKQLLTGTQLLEKLDIA